MAGTHEGSKKAVKTILTREPDFFKRVGKLGGSKSRPETRPFFLNRELARSAGARGGRISRRTKAKVIKIKVK